MASILNATTSSGLVTSADNSGSLQLATNNGTTAVTIDTSQNVGIGTASPSTRLHVAGATTATSQLTTQHTGSAVTTIFGCDGGIDAGAVYVTTNHPLSFKTNNTEQARITSAGLMQFNSGYGSVATAYGCRAWVNFNGTGTVAIRASGNVSSITDNGTGDYTVNFTTAMPDANYSFGGYCVNPASRALIFGDTSTYATGSLRVSVGYVSGFNGDITKIDASVVNIEIFR
jgi:hypothetical protein